MRGIELTPEAPVADVVELGRRAADVGFDVAFASCHYNNRDPFPVLDRLASATEDLRVGTGVANPYETHPVTLASRLATLQESSGGRAIFGVGAGDRSTLSNLGVERDRPLRRVLETIRVARALWAGERVDHDGTFVARDAGLNYSVDPLPVYVGAQGPDMLRMAGKYADGVLVNAAHPLDVARAAERVREGAAERDETVRVVSGTPDVTVYASVSVAEDTDAAREAARPPVAFIAAGAPPETLARHGLDAELAARLSDRIGAGRFSEAFEAVSEPMLDAFCIAGTPASVAARFDALAEHADGVVAGSPLGPERGDAVTLLADAFERSSMG